jgi:outer membrane protein OmpA-like peptidoglycan-associated protein
LGKLSGTFLLNNKIRKSTQTIGLVVSAFVAAICLGGCGVNGSPLLHSAAITNNSGQPNSPSVPNALNPITQLPIANLDKSDLPNDPTDAANIPASALFATGQSSLLSSAESVLSSIANEIKGLEPNAQIEFVGHADSRGSASANLTLSIQRASTVMNWFLNDGFKASNLTSTGVGSTDLPVPDLTANGVFIPSAGAADRCVEVVIKQ